MNLFRGIYSPQRLSRVATATGNGADHAVDASPAQDAGASIDHAKLLVWAAGVVLPWIVVGAIVWLVIAAR